MSDLSSWPRLSTLQGTKWLEPSLPRPGLALQPSGSPRPSSQRLQPHRRRLVVQPAVGVGGHQAQAAPGHPAPTGHTRARFRLLRNLTVLRLIFLGELPLPRLEQET